MQKPARAERLLRPLLNYGILGDGSEGKLQHPVTVAAPSRDGRGPRLLAVVHTNNHLSWLLLDEIAGSMLKHC